MIQITRPRECELSSDDCFAIGKNVRSRPCREVAVIAVGHWIGHSYVLGLNVRRFAYFSKTYRTMGAAIARMVWLYWTVAEIFVRADIEDSELAKISDKDPLEQSPSATRIN